MASASTATACFSTSMIGAPAAARRVAGRFGRCRSAPAPRGRACATPCADGCARPGSRRSAGRWRHRWRHRGRDRGPRAGAAAGWCARRGRPHQALDPAPQAGVAGQHVVERLGWPAGPARPRGPWSNPAAPNPRPVPFGIVGDHDPAIVGRDRRGRGRHSRLGSRRPVVSARPPSASALGRTAHGLDRKIDAAAPRRAAAARPTGRDRRRDRSARRRGAWRRTGCASGRYRCRVGRRCAATGRGRRRSGSAANSARPLLTRPSWSS